MEFLSPNPVWPDKKNIYIEKGRLKNTLQFILDNLKQWLKPYLKLYGAHFNDVRMKAMSKYFREN